MSPRAATAYPWKALETITVDGARRAARARRQVQAVLDIARIGAALSELSECEASLVVRRVSNDMPRRRPLAELGFELGSGGVLCTLFIEPEFAANLLARILRRPVALSSQAALDDALAGAFAAVVLEVARRSGARAALHLIDASEAFAKARDVFVEATVLVAGTAYQVVAALGLPELTEVPALSLSALGELEVALPLVIGLGLAERAALADFSPGNAWFPGAGLWLDPQGEGRVALAAATRDEGVSGTLSRDGKIVIRGEGVALPFDSSEALGDSKRDEPMSDSEKPDPSRLSEAVLDSPIVVRVEMGAVSMTAREWAELGPGDVIETGRRIAEPVILRVAGREVARGELVNLEGELGVRIRELVRS
jgi:flagellar motor switch/type III secretory pathway protein FliN